MNSRKKFLNQIRGRVVRPTKLFSATIKTCLVGPKLRFFATKPKCSSTRAAGEVRYAPIDPQRHELHVENVGKRMGLPIMRLTDRDSRGERVTGSLRRLR